MYLNENKIRQLIKEMIIQEGRFGSIAKDRSSTVQASVKKGSEELEDPHSGVILGEKFSFGGVIFQSMPYRGAADRAMSMHRKLAGRTDKGSDEDKQAVIDIVYKVADVPGYNTPEKLENLKSRLGTKRESFWSSWFYTAAYKPDATYPNRNSMSYPAANAYKNRIKILNNPVSFKDKELYVMFKPEEAPILPGDGIFKWRAESKGRSFESLGQGRGPAHMRILGTDGKFYGGNESGTIKGTMMSMNGDLFKEQSGYIGVFKRVKVLGEGTLANVEDEKNLTEGKFGSIKKNRMRNYFQQSSPNKKKETDSTRVEGLEDVDNLGVSQKGIDLILSHEGFRAFVYDDKGNTRKPLSSYASAIGTPTIGYGKAIQSAADREKFKDYLASPGKRLSKSEGMEMFKQILPKYTRWKSKISAPLTQNMFDALTSYAYNTGNGGITKYKNNRGQSIADLINSGDYVGAADVISKKPVVSKGTRLAGLVRRRKEESDLFLQGVENVNKQGRLNISKSNTTGGKDSWKGRLGSETRGGINFHKILDGKNNYRGGIKGKHTNPTVDFWKELYEEYKIKNVIALSGDKVGKLAANNAEKAGLKVYRNFINENNMGNRSKFNNAKNILRQGNTLIYCTHGADRTGAYVGRYYMEELGWDFNKARSDTRKYGGHKPGSGYKSARDFLEFGPPMSEGRFGRISRGGSSTGSNVQFSSGSKKKDIENNDNFESSDDRIIYSGENTGAIALVGDSQMKGGIGKALKKLFPGVIPVSKTGKQPVAFANDRSTINSISGARKIILTLGGNGTSGTRSLIKTIKSYAPNAEVVWIGAPPATRPTGGSNSMVSTDPSSNKYYVTKNKRRMNNNRKIKSAVEAAGFTFINPVDYYNFRPSRDGIHVDRDGVPFINKIRNILV